MVLTSPSLQAIQAAGAGDAWQPRIVESGWLPAGIFPKCLPFFSSVDDCLEAAYQESLTAAHYSAHAAGLIKPPSIKAKAREVAIRSALAAGDAGKAKEALAAFKAWDRSTGVLGLAAAATTPFTSPAELRDRCSVQPRSASASCGSGGCRVSR